MKTLMSGSVIEPTTMVMLADQIAGQRSFGRGNRRFRVLTPALGGQVWRPRRAVTANVLLGRLAVIELKQPAQPLGFGNRTGFLNQPWIRAWDEIIEALVVSLLVKMGQILLEHVGQGAVTKENQVVQTLAFDRADPAFGVSIQIGAPRWQFEGLNTGPFQDAVKTCGLLAVPVVDQIAGVAQLASDSGDVASDLFNPSFVR